MSTGTRHQLLLLSAPGDNAVVSMLAQQLTAEGLLVKLEAVGPEALAAAAATALDQAELVLLAVSAVVQRSLAEGLAAARAEALPAGRLLVLQLDAGAIEPLPAAVEVIAWPRQGDGRGKSRRQRAVARILELADSIPSALHRDSLAPENAGALALAAAQPAESTDKKQSRRDDFSTTVRLTLSRRVGGFCSRPGCKNHTSGPHANPDKVNDTGVAAHITAAAPGGPRYNPDLTSAERKAANNGMWLCQFCAKLIDSDAATYPEALLREWKAWAEEAQRDRQLGSPRGRSDWSWPGGAWNFGPYRQERCQGFVGRRWLLAKVRAWAANPDAAQALLIGADFGVGKTAFLAKLLDHEHAAENPEFGDQEAGPGLPLLAQHFCRWEENAYLSPGRFVQSLAAQLKEELPAYRKALEVDDATSLRESLNRAEAEPLRAFQQALVAPLAAIPAPATRRLLVIDALDEALDHRPSGGGASRYTIVDLLAREARNLPAWLRVLATSRRRPEVLEPLRQGFFSIEEINAEEAENLADIHDYVEARCQQQPLAAILSRAGLSARDTAKVLQAKSGGKFLYAVRVLNDITSAALQLQNRQSLDALPPGMDGFYEDTFKRRFPEPSDYSPVKPLLALLCAQREPMGYGQLAAILGVCTDQIGIWIQPLEDLLRFQATPPSDQSSASTEEWRISFDHASLEQWLTERSGGRIPGPRAGRYGVNRDEAAEQIRTWALAEVKAHRAHTSPYLVRHLASHLNAEERPELIASQLRQFAWLQARLHLAGLNALLGDFDRTTDGPANFPPELQRVGRALRQGAHVLSHEGGWNGQEQLASQLLARLADDGALEGLRLQAAAWLKKVGRAYPRTSSLLAQAALLRTLLVGGFVTSLVILPDGRLACGRQDGSIHLWDSASGSCSAVFEGHQGWVKALVVLSDGRLASGATVDHTIRIWDPVTCACSAVLEGHQDGINTLTVLPDGDLASGSSDSTIRIWDLLSLSCRAVFEQHVRPVTALGVLMDGRLISMSSAFWGETADADQILIWDPKAGDYLEVFADVSHDAPLAIMPDGRIAFVFNSTLEGGSVHLWDVATASCSAVLHGHSTGVGAIAVLPDGRLATAYWDNTIHVWDLTTGTFSAVLHGESIEGGVDAMAVFPDGRIASAFDDAIHIWDPSIRDCFAIREGDKGPVHALVSLSDGHVASACGYQEGIRIWDPDKGSCIAVLDGHTQTIYSLAVLPDGRLASGSWDETIRLWDINIGTCSAIFEGLKGYVQALAVLPDGRLASGSSQTEDTIRICDPANGSCIAFLDGHEKRVDALAVLPDGRLASCSGDDGTIRLWDISTGACSAILHGSAGEMAVIPDGRLASVSNGNCILLRDLASPGRNPEVIFVTDAMITALMALPGKSLLVAGDYGGRLHWLELGGQRP